MSALCPPHKRRKLMRQSVTDSSTTPSPPPPSTPVSVSHKSITFLSGGIPHVNSTPIRNYFASFCGPSYSSPKKKRISSRTYALQRQASPRTLWKRSGQIIPFPPSKRLLSSPFSSSIPSPSRNRKRRHIDIDVDKFDAFYHPLTATIESRPDLNVFNDSYFQKTKKYYDEQPFLDPTLHSKMRDDLFKLLCDLNDQNNSSLKHCGGGSGGGMGSDKSVRSDQDSDVDYVKVASVVPSVVGSFNDSPISPVVGGDDHNQSLFSMDRTFNTNITNISSISNTNKDAADALDTFGDHGITKMLAAFDDDDHLFEDEDDDLVVTPMDRAQRLIHHLRSDTNRKQRKPRKSSYESTCEGMVFLSGVLEYIVTVVLDSAGLIAKSNHSIMTSEQHHAERFRSEMADNELMVTQYDRDVFEHDINRDLVVIRPIHIRHAIHDDDGLFWLQQSIQTVHLDEESVNGINLNMSRSEDIQDALDMDCVSHICSFFRGDLPMLSSLARVNMTFYATTSSNTLWRPIAIRCFLFNPEIVHQIGDSENGESEVEDEESTSEIVADFRSYISQREFTKLSVMRERWMKQDVESGDGKFEIYVRINPVYTELHETLYQLLYGEESNGDAIDHETYDIFRSLLEIFGNRRDFLTVSQIINNVKCLNAEEMQHRLGKIFGKKVSQDAEQELKRVIEIEYESLDDNVLFLEVPLSDSCIDKDSVDRKRHVLWLGRNTAVFSVIGKTWNDHSDCRY